MTAVDHEVSGELVSFQLRLSFSDALRVEVGSLLSTTEDNEAIGITDGTDNSDNTGLSDRQEVVGVLDGANGVDSDVKRSIGTVLETDRERQTGGKLTVDLGLGGSGTDSTNRETVVKELGGDGIKHFGGNGHALVRQVSEELARGTETLVDFEAVVKVRVVDQTLPADCCTGFLEVRPHDDEEIVLVLLLELKEAVAVFEGHGGVVDGAWSDNDEETVLAVFALDDGAGIGTAFQDRLSRCVGQCDFMLEEVWWGEWVVATDCKRNS